METARGLVRAASTEHTPTLLDPFSGGGSIPFEALRVGCETFGADLNPVACLILKVMLEDIPRHGMSLASELLRLGEEVQLATQRALAEYYPTEADGSIPVAYLLSYAPSRMLREG